MCDWQSLWQHLRRKRADDVKMLSALLRNVLCSLYLYVASTLLHQCIQEETIVFVNVKHHQAIELFGENFQESYFYSFEKQESAPVPGFLFARWYSKTTSISFWSGFVDASKSFFSFHSNILGRCWVGEAASCGYFIFPFLRCMKSKKFA